MKSPVFLRQDALKAAQQEHFVFFQHLRRKALANVIITAGGSDGDVVGQVHSGGAIDPFDPFALSAASGRQVDQTVRRQFFQHFVNAAVNQARVMSDRRIPDIVGNAFFAESRPDFCPLPAGRFSHFPLLERCSGMSTNRRSTSGCETVSIRRLQPQTILKLRNASNRPQLSFSTLLRQTNKRLIRALSLIP